METFLIGEGGLDGFIYMWNVLYFWKSLLGLQTPFSTLYIFYPLGANLVFHTLSPIVSLFGLPFLNNLVLYMNIVAVLSLVLASQTMFYLASYLTKNSYLAAIAGVIYGFSPIMMSFLLSQHYYFAVAAILYPLGVLFIIKFLDLSKQKYLLFAFLVGWICFFIDYYSVIIYSIIVFIVYLLKLFDLYKDQKFYIVKLLIKHLGIGLIAVFLPLFLLFSVFFHFKDFSYWQNGGVNILHYQCNTNILGFIIPNAFSSHLSFLSNLLYKTFAIMPSSDTPSYFLGFTFFTLSIIGVIKLRSDINVKIFATIAVIFLLLSLGSEIKIGNLVVASGTFTPFYWFTKIPYLNLIDCPVRFSIAIQLALAILIVLFLNQIIKQRKVSSWKILIAFLGLFVLEYGVTNIPLTKVEIPQVYKMIASHKDNFTVLEIPSGLSESKGSFGNDYSFAGLASKPMYWQTIYQKPRVGGYISRIPESTYKFFMNEPIISDLFYMSSYNGKWPGNIYNKEEVTTFLDKFNIGYIILLPSYKQQEYLEKIDNLLTGIEYSKYKNEGYILYKLN